MMIRRDFLSVAILVSALFAASIIVSATADAAVTEQQVRQMIEKTYDVRVLKLVKGEMEGKPVFLVTIMTGGGNDNDAFQVNRLAVDVETGKLVSGFRHNASGYDLPGGARDNEVDRQPTDVLRQGWNWR